MRRREFLGSLLGMMSAAVLPAASAAHAQPQAAVIGFLQRSNPVRTDFADFRNGLKALGYEDGRNIQIVQRYAGLDADRLRVQAQELAAMNVRVIVTDGLVTIKAATAAAKQTPIVSPYIAGTTEYGIASLSRPGGNLTGLSNMRSELGGKRLELIREFMPEAKTIAVLRDRDGDNPAELRVLENVSKTLGFELRVFMAGKSDTWREAFDEIAAYRPDAVLQLPNATFAGGPKELVALAVERRLPVVYAEREFVDSGGLMSYGISYSDQWRRAAGFVDRILKGAKPGDLPIEQPVKFDLVVNVRTARAVGLTMPTPTLLRATEVIE